MRFAGRHHDRLAKNFVDSADLDFKARLCWGVPEFPDQCAPARVEDPGRVRGPPFQRGEPSRDREERKTGAGSACPDRMGMAGRQIGADRCPGALAGRRRTARQQIRSESDSPRLSRKRSQRRLEQPKGHCSGGNHGSAGNHPASRDSRPGEGDRSFGQAGSRRARDLGRRPVFSGTRHGRADRCERRLQSASVSRRADTNQRGAQRLDARFARGQHRAEHASGRFSTATRQETADSVRRPGWRSPPWRFRFNRTLARRSQPRVERERRREVQDPEHL